MVETASTERWEYRTVKPPRGATNKEVKNPEPLLNELGGDGWEFVATLDYVGGGTKYLVLKRPVRDSDRDER